MMKMMVHDGEHKVTFWELADANSNFTAKLEC